KGHGPMDKPREGEGARPLAGTHDHALDSYVEAEAIALRRDRLLAALTLIAGAGLAVALVPLLEWFERRGLPSAISALLCVILFLVIANIAVAAIVLPATEWVR